jgi:hypothetical protein
MTMDLTPAERAQWREQAFDPADETGIDSWIARCVTLDDALDAAEAERDRLREQVAAAEALAEQWVENARRADATADARTGSSAAEDLRRYANGRRADAATLLLAIGGQIDQQDGGGER